MSIDEKTYRQLLDDTFARVDRAFETVDPDVAEVSLSQGTLTIAFFEKQRLMLTPQPSPRQLWAAFRDRAWHFDHGVADALDRSICDAHCGAADGANARRRDAIGLHQRRFADAVGGPAGTETDCLDICRAQYNSSLGGKNRSC